MPVQVDAYLDPLTGDLPAVSRLTTGIELIQQRIRTRLRRGTNEWFLDPAGTGLPLIEWRGQKPPDVQAIVNRVQSEIASIPGVTGTSNFTGTHDPAARRLTISGDVLAADGTVTSVVVVGVQDGRRNTMSFGLFFSSNAIPGGIPRITHGGP